MLFKALVDLIWPYVSDVLNLGVLIIGLWVVWLIVSAPIW